MNEALFNEKLKNLAARAKADDDPNDGKSMVKQLVDGGMPEQQADSIINKSVRFVLVEANKTAEELVVQGNKVGNLIYYIMHNVDTGSEMVRVFPTNKAASSYFSRHRGKMDKPTYEALSHMLNTRYRERIRCAVHIKWNKKDFIKCMWLARNDEGKFL